MNESHEKYRQALRYALKCNRDMGHDLVHEAFSMNYNKDQTNLLEKPLYTILNFVKYAWFLERRRGQHQFKGEITYDTFREIKEWDLISEEDGFSDVQFIEVLEEEIVNYKSTIKNNSVDGDTLLKHFRLMCEGYNLKEIAEKLNIGHTTSRYYRDKIVGIFNKLGKEMILNNPLNGNKLVIKKSITLAQWEKRIDKEDFILNDYNEYLNLYEHKESGEGLLVRLPEEKTNPYIK